MEPQQSSELPILDKKGWEGLMRRWVELEEMARLLGLISEKEKKSFCSGFGMQAWLWTKSFFLKFLRISRSYLNGVLLNVTMRW